MKKNLLLLSLMLATSIGYAQAPPAQPSGQFDVVDVSGQVIGDLKPSSNAARADWVKACSEWKSETKDLNKNNEVLGINCNQASCNLIDAANWQCTSMGTYKVKTAGTRVNNTNVAPPFPEPPVSAPLPPEHEIATAPPQVIVEAVPTPRVGFVWIPGYWGWGGRGHVWIPGRWANERPGYFWVGERWERHGRGWHFQPGRWDRH